jgi:hypothetical protein
MNVIGFLCVSLDNSTVQLHDSLGMFRGWFQCQNGDCAKGVYYRRKGFSCTFSVGKGLNAEERHKETFPLYGGKCLSCKAVHNWAEKLSQGLSKVADGPVNIVAEATVKRFLC